MFIQILGLLLYFIMKIEVFIAFYFSKKFNFQSQKLVSLVIVYLKKMDPGSSCLSYIQTNSNNCSPCF